MKFKCKVTVFGNSWYDIEATDEAEARKKAKELAEKDYTFEGKKLYYGMASFLCVNCKNELYPDSNFCSKCGKAFIRSEKQEEGKQ